MSYEVRVDSIRSSWWRRLSVDTSTILEQFDTFDSPAFLHWRGDATDEAVLKELDDQDAGDCPTPLHATPKKGCSKLALAILKKSPFDINIRATNATSLQIAAGQQHFEIVRLLLELGADPDAQAGHAGTAFFAALKG